MGEDVPKPYLEIAGKTILEYTLRQFVQLESLKQVIIATSADLARHADLQESVPAHVDFRIVHGGATRQESVGNALEEVDETADLVAIHDAVRPFVKRDDILRCLRTASMKGGAVLGIPVSDTIKEVDEKEQITDTPDRRTLWQAQTPQIFQLNLIRRAYENARRKEYSGTDDSSLVEFLGEEVFMVAGSGDNFKITYSHDLKLAARMLDQS